MGTYRKRLHLSWGCSENQGLGMFELERERMALCRRENRGLNTHGGRKLDVWSKHRELGGLATSYEFSGWEWKLDTSVWIRHSRTLNTSLRNFFIKQRGFFGYLWAGKKKKKEHIKTQYSLHCHKHNAIYFHLVQRRVDLPVFKIIEMYSTVLNSKLLPPDLQSQEKLGHPGVSP